MLLLPLHKPCHGHTPNVLYEGVAKLVIVSDAPHHRFVPDAECRLQIGDKATSFHGRQQNCYGQLRRCHNMTLCRRSYDRSCGVLTAPCALNGLGSCSARTTRADVRANALLFGDRSQHKGPRRGLLLTTGLAEIKSNTVPGHNSDRFWSPSPDPVPSLLQRRGRHSVGLR